MLKKITLLLFLCSAVSFGQNVTIKGQVTDPDNYPLESATIYLTSVKDSTVIDYTISDKKGNWEIRTRSKQEPVNLKISFIGFSDFRQKLNNLTQDKDFGILKMSDNPTELNEVVIKNEIPPIRIKSDTLEFNASSFKVRPDSNVQTLLKQLPGVDIDSDGKITVNGKEVNQILVNGKPFFDKDGKVALQNLPAEIIDKVQVTDTKTKKEELTGKAASGDNASINLTIQKDKNKGFFGKFMGGYGTDDRYESSALVNYFKDKRKISILASSNNINSSGFSMNEIF
ncbi:carboxypeptidase-like regulatory domain-containing protein, partial [uncultured Flavobacterium sp.]|uniref:carboxypeptidase-like regulatory domain-containing protein n=1 Tax=uncultured Flavobacterium sp. TaxID=165435 RepID=UPI0025E42B2B